MTEYKSPIVINMAGAPGSGKSTGAAQIFCELKKRGVNCELIDEFAKAKTWENNSAALRAQEYIFGKQSYKMARCRDDVDVIITDSPLILSILYNKNPALDEHFEAVVMNVFNTYRNINFMVRRVKKYNPKGRNQNEDESDALGIEIVSLYDRLGIPYEFIDGNDEGYNYAVQKVLNMLNIQ